MKKVLASALVGLVALVLSAPVSAGLLAAHQAPCGCAVEAGVACAAHCGVRMVRTRGHFERVVEMVNVCQVVRRPVVETFERDVTYTVCRPVYEDVTRDVAYTACRPEAYTRKVCVDRGRWQSQTYEVPGPVICRRVWVPCIDPCAGCCDPCARRICPRGRFEVVPVQCPPRVCVRNFWVPNVVEEEITCTRLVPVVMTKTCTYKVCRMVPEVQTRRIQETRCRWVCETVQTAVPRTRCVWIPGECIPVPVACPPPCPPRCCTLCGLTRLRCRCAAVPYAGYPPMAAPAPEAALHPAP